MMMSEAMQAATQVIESANSGLRIWLDGGMITLILTNLFFILRKNKSNGTTPQVPGQAEICQKRGERLAIVETKVGGVEENIKEIKEAIQDIRDVVIGK